MVNPQFYVGAAGRLAFYPSFDRRALSIAGAGRWKNPQPSCGASGARGSINLGTLNQGSTPMNWRTRRASVARGHQSPFTVSMLALFIDSMAGGVGWVGSLLLATRQRCCGVIPAKNHEPPFSLKNMIDTTQYVMTQTKKTPDGIAKAKKLYWIDCLSFAAVAKIIFGNRNAQMRIRRWIGPGERNRRGSNANKQKNESIKRHAKKLILVEGLSFRKVARRLGVCPETVSFLIGRPFPSRVKKETLSTLNAK